MSSSRFGILIRTFCERKQISLLIHNLNIPEEVDGAIHHVWVLIRLVRCQEANMLVDRLLPAINVLVNSKDQAFLRRLANIQHVAGYIKSQVTRANETAILFAHYQEMEQVAHILNDQTLLTLTLTYEGDGLQRGANVEDRATLALSADSEQRYSEAREVYQRMLLQWPHEQKVKNLAQLFQ